MARNSGRDRGRRAFGLDRLLLAKQVQGEGRLVGFRAAWSGGLGRQVEESAFRVSNRSGPTVPPERAGTTVLGPSGWLREMLARVDTENAEGDLREWVYEL